MKTILKKQIEVVDHSATGKMMRNQRESSGLSLREIARRLHVSAAYLSDLELGKRNWNEKRATKFLKACLR